MATPFLGEVQLISFPFPPKGWALCNGQLMSIAQNQALFSILGTTYGGNGVTTFALPNLQSRIVPHPGNGFQLGQVGGEATHSLTVTEMPAHTHQARARSSADSAVPTTAVWSGSNTPQYGSSNDVAMASDSLTSAGTGQPHDNLPPYLVLNYVIALQGIFPSRN